MRSPGRPRNPVSDSGDPIQVFALQLRQLHEKAGFPSAKALQRAGVAASYSSVVTATRGDTLPTWDITKAIVHVCRASEKEWQKKWITARHAAEQEGLPVCQLPAELTASGPPVRAARVVRDTAAAPPEATLSESAAPKLANTTAGETATITGQNTVSRWRRLWPSRRGGKVALLVIAMALSAAVVGGIVWSAATEQAPTCDDIGVALDDVAHRVHQQAWIDAYNAYGGRDALGCPREEREQGLVHPWGPGLSQDLSKDGQPTRLMSITPDTVIVMTGRYFYDYTEPHWNQAARLQGYPESNPIPCGKAQVVYLTAGDYSPGAMVSSPDGRFVWLPRPMWLRYLEHGGPKGPFGRPLNALSTYDDIEGTIEFENGGFITLHAGTARLTPATGSGMATVPAPLEPHRPC